MNKTFVTIKVWFKVILEYISANTLFKIVSTLSTVIVKVKLKLVLTICSPVPTTRKNDWPS